MDATENGKDDHGDRKNDENAVITAGVDTYTETPNDYPVFDSVEKCTEDADVVIDFQMREQWIRFWIIAWIRNFRLCFARQDFRKSSLQSREGGREDGGVKVGEYVSWN